jgi:hypothetical protein
MVHATLIAFTVHGDLHHASNSRTDVTAVSADRC